MKAGSTGVACFLTENSLCLSWVGDSQALLLRGVPGLNTRKFQARQKDADAAAAEKAAEKNGAASNGATNGAANGAANGQQVS